MLRKVSGLNVQQNVGKNRNVKTFNKSSENVVNGKYLGTILWNKNFIYLETKNRLN